MASDPEMTSLAQWVMSLLGLAGGGGAVAKTVLDSSAVQARLKALEETQGDHAAKIDTGAAVVGRIEGRLSEMSGTLNSIRDMLMRRD